MDTQLTMQRIQRARRAMVQAQNPEFRKFWFGVANKLADSLGPGQPWLRTYDGKLK